MISYRRPAVVFAGGLLIGAAIMVSSGGDAVTLVSAKSQSPIVPIECPEKLTQQDQLLCHCDSASTQTGTLWGDGRYTDDSNICRAARHAGMIGDDGGMVAVYAEPGLPQYAGTQRNGISSASWGSWSRSIAFTWVDQSKLSSDYPALALSECPQNAQGLNVGDSLSCSCPSGLPSGSVWGSGPYTADSPICRAARHAGKIGTDGGNVKIRATAGQSSYKGSTRNGVGTSNWNSFPKSYRFD